MSERRLNRLQNDYNEMLELHKRNGLIYVVATEGNPPERYLIGFRCRGVAEITNDHPRISEKHLVEIILTIDYPRMRPMVLWKTPIFHPNFANGNVCWEWYPQQSLRRTCEIFAEMVQYKNYNSTSPLDMTASVWAMKHRSNMPIDPRNLFEAGGQPAQPISTTMYSTQAVVRNFVPIHVQPLSLQSSDIISPASTRLAQFCGNCAFKFTNPDARFCPQCGQERITIATSY